ncbi:MAG: queuosine precursor transporter [Chitinophagales bacterium]|nr:queuosine precursor transporter [Chitinophagales bacterium]
MSILTRDETPSNYERIFIILSGFFIASLVLTNLIAGRFFTINIPTLNVDWHLTSGVIAYPITFLVTDIISEIYGEKRAKLLVFTGFIISVFTVVIIITSISLPIWDRSPVSEASYNNVFGLAPGIVFGSMVAYLSAQFIDVKLFEFWRKLTKGKHLWLRNNGSTIISQLVDSVLVVIIALIIYPTITGVSEPLTWKEAYVIIVGQYIFKALLALFDTPFIYLSVYLINKKL